MLHGLRGTHQGLRAIADILTQNAYHTITPDLPGSGDSAPLEDQTLRGYVEWLHRFIEAQQLSEKPVLIGHSMGSVIASHHALQYPDDTGRELILMSPVFRSPAEQELSTRLNSGMDTLIHILPENIRTDLLNSKAVSYGVSRYLTADRSQQKKIDRLHAEYSGHFASADSFLSDARIAQCAQAVIPEGKDVLLIMGKKDRLISAKFVQEVADMTHTKLVLIPNAGHLINYEQPAKAAHAIMEYLSVK